MFISLELNLSLLLLIIDSNYKINLYIMLLYEIPKVTSIVKIRSFLTSEKKKTSLEFYKTVCLFKFKFDTFEK